MKKLLTIMAALFAVGILPASGHAVCVRTNYYVAGIATFPGAAQSYIYLRSSPLSSTIFFGLTPAANFITTAANAAATQTTVTVTGNAASCPASDSIGSITSLVMP